MMVQQTLSMFLLGVQVGMKSPNKDFPTDSIAQPMKSMIEQVRCGNGEILRKGLNSKCGVVVQEDVIAAVVERLEEIRRDGEFQTVRSKLSLCPDAESAMEMLKPFLKEGSHE